MFWSQKRYIAFLESSIKSLEAELKRTQDLREADLKRWEREREVMVSRLLQKHGVPEPTSVAGKGGVEGVMEMPVFNDLEEEAQEAAEARKSGGRHNREALDAFAG